MPLLVPAGYLILLSVRAIECALVLFSFMMERGQLAKLISFFHVSSDFLIFVVRDVRETQSCVLLRLDKSSFSLHS